MSKKVFDAKNWIELGLTTLKEEGLGKFSVEAIARKVGVTKGSFYWHFKDREAFFKAIVDYWLEQQHKIIEDFKNHGHNDPKKQLWDLMHYILNKNTDHDIAMRSWVAHYDYAHKAVKQSDKMQLTYLEMLFIKMGFSKDEAKLRAQMLYLYQIGENTILVKERQSVRSRMNKMQYQMLIGEAV